MFYSWLSVGIAVVNKEYFEINPGAEEPDRDPLRHHNLTIVPWATPKPPKIYQSPSIDILDTQTHRPLQKIIASSAMVIVLFCRTQQNGLRALSFRKPAQLTASLLVKYDNIVR